jgi:predicted RNase H-like HicB family nuclease
MRSYAFPVVIEPDEDVWRAYVPDLESKGAATWGHTKE